MATYDVCMSDYEEILKVFPESVQNVCKENPDALSYLSDLSAAGLQRLHQEPSRLVEEKSSILEQTQDLAFKNYKTFIQTAECSHKIFQDFNIVESRLQSLLNKLPEFSEKCQDFSKQAQGINSRWQEMSLTLSKHSQLLEFLELPQLMDTCVKNGYYEEALEIASYVRRLDRKHSNIPIIADIVKNVQCSLNVMLLQLLSQLRTNIQLPICLKIIGFLRRMDAFSELELRIKFLQARGTWFKEIVDNISKEDPYQHIIKVIENSRIHLFDIITQYRAIFSDDDPLLLTAKDGGNSETAVFQSWIALKTSEFINILKNDLEFDLGSRIDSVYAQCMYFGLSFSRVGIEFRPLLVPIFESVMLNKFLSMVYSATARFEEAMLTYTFVNYTMTVSTSAMSASILANDNLQPPNSLLDFQPLAQYLNDILIALNEFKLCSSFSIASSVVEALQNSLKQVASVIVGYYGTEETTMTEAESDMFIKFCRQFLSELIPHLENCIVVIFPPEEISSILGITPLEFSKLGNVFTLDKDIICAQLKALSILKDDDDERGIIITIKDESLSDDVVEETEPSLSTPDVPVIESIS